MTGGTTRLLGRILLALVAAGVLLVGFGWVRTGQPPAIGTFVMLGLLLLVGLFTQTKAKGGDARG